MLPAVSLSTIVLGRLARLVRSSMLEVLAQDYVRTARAKGLAETRWSGGHALKNAAIPIVTVVGLQLGPAPGRRRRHRDDLRLARRRRAGGRGRRSPVTSRSSQGVTLVISLIFVAANLAVDLAYVALNPRIRLG